MATTVPAKLERKWVGPAVGVTVLIVGIVLALVSWHSTAGPSAVAPKAFFTDDDGATYFTDRDAHLVPFDHDGRPAVTAHVFKTSSGKMFVGWEERNTDAALAVLKAIQQAEEHPDVPFKVTPQQRQIISAGREYKKPSDKGWTPEPPGDGHMFAATMSRSIKSPDGSNAEEVRLSD